MTNRPSDRIDDANLLHAFAAGGGEEARAQEAFRQLVERHVELVYGTARRILRDAHLAEDVTQSVFIVLAQRAAKIRPGTPLVGWLYKVTHFACANVQRVEARRRRHESEAAAMRMTATEKPLLTDSQVLLDRALLRLPARERDAVLLRFAQGYTVAEIASATGISQPAAKKRLERGLARLRSYFAASGSAADQATPPALHALTPGNSGMPAGLALTVSAAALTKGLASAQALATAHAAIRMMVMGKVKTALLAMAACAAIIPAVQLVRLAQGSLTPPASSPPPLVMAAPATGQSGTGQPSMRPALTRPVTTAVAAVNMSQSVLFPVSIHGTIVDRYGKPAVGAQIRYLAGTINPIQPHSISVQWEEITTNDRGEFTLGKAIGGIKFLLTLRVTVRTSGPLPSMDEGMVSIYTDIRQPGDVTIETPIPVVDARAYNVNFPEDRNARVPSGDITDYMRTHALPSP